MSARSASPRMILFGDACLLTAGAFVIALAIGGGIVQLLARGALDDTPAAMALGPIFTFSPFLIGAIGTWLLHGKRMSWLAGLGMFLGLIAGAAIVAIFVTAMVGLVRPLAGQGAEIPILFAVVGLVGLAFLALVGSLVVRALRDLRSPAPAEPRLDRFRLGSAVAIALLAIAIGVFALFEPGSEILEALPFTIITGLCGGLMATGADILTSRRGRRSPGGESLRVTGSDDGASATGVLS